jgi:hypothetical protein
VRGARACCHFIITTALMIRATDFQNTRITDLRESLQLSNNRRYILSPLGSKLIFQFSLHLNPTTKSICRLSGRIPKYTDGSRTHRDILGGAWKDVPTEENNKRARHTYDRFRLRFPSVKMSPRQIRKMVLWHYRVVNLQDTLSGVQLRRTQRLLVSLEAFTPKCKT